MVKKMVTLLLVSLVSTAAFGMNEGDAVAQIVETAAPVVVETAKAVVETAKDAVKAPTRMTKIGQSVKGGLNSLYQNCGKPRDYAVDFVKASPAALRDFVKGVYNRTVYPIECFDKKSAIGLGVAALAAGTVLVYRNWTSICDKYNKYSEKLNKTLTLEELKKDETTAETLVRDYSKKQLNQALVQFVLQDEVVCSKVKAALQLIAVRAEEQAKKLAEEKAAKEVAKNQLVVATK